MRLVLLAAAGGLVLAGCQDRVQAPEAPDGTCFLVAPQEDGTINFTAMPDLQPNMENCAARLEENRVRWLRMGGTRRQVIGYYGGQYLFVDGAGVSLSQSLDGGRFVALRRTSDGRLAIPGVFEQAPPDAPAEGG